MSTLREDIKISKSILINESYNATDPFALVYYHTVGKHSNGESFKDFNPGLKLLSREIKNTDGVEYIGLEPQDGGGEFAVGFVIQRYIDNAKDAFDDPKALASFKKVALQCLKTGKIVKGKY